MSICDISFQIDQTIFHYRVGCLIIKEGKLLVMRENLNDSYGYIPGGRVKIGEDGMLAIAREMDEELSIID